jgi:hypothetical protein
VSYLPSEAHKTQFVLQGRPGYMRYSKLRLDPRIPAAVHLNENMRCLAVLPILHHGQVIANLTISRTTCPTFLSKRVWYWKPSWPSWGVIA